MAVSTCAEMVARCLERDQTAWRQFIGDHVPFAAAILDRYFPALASRREELCDALLARTAADECRFFRDYSGQSDREFLLHLRDLAIEIGSARQPAAPAPDVPLDWETFDKAFAGFTALERQGVWLFVLAPQAGDRDKILRLAPEAAAAHLSKAQEALRAACDRWSADMLAQNAPLLAREARAHRTNDCAEPKKFLHLLDGQTTWRDREILEQHLAACWHCVDVLSRFRESIFLARSIQPLPQSQIEAYWKRMNIESPRPSRWKLLFGRG
jgi:hypothetical protein